MPRAQKLTRYPREYAQLFIKAADPSVGEEGIRIINADEKQATTFRGQLYAFVRSVERATPEERKMYGLTTEVVGAVFMSIEGNALVLRNKAHSPSAIRVRAALQSLGHNVQAGGVEIPDADALMKRMLGEVPNAS